LTVIPSYRWGWGHLTLDTLEYTLYL
jgi:hypothetical protein